MDFRLLFTLELTLAFWRAFATVFSAVCALSLKTPVTDFLELQGPKPFSCHHNRSNISLELIFKTGIVSCVLVDMDPCFINMSSLLFDHALGYSLFLFAKENCYTQRQPALLDIYSRYLLHRKACQTFLTRKNGTRIHLLAALQ